MLTEDEEYMLNAIIEINKSDLVYGIVEDLKTQLERIEWLSDRLKTVNNELRTANNAKDYHNVIDRYEP